MKSRTLMWITPVILFAVVALPTRLAAQSDPAKIPRHHHYKLIDMGTFGGPKSNPAQEFSLTEHKVMVGWSATSAPTTPSSNPIVCGGVDGWVPFITVTFQWQDGTLTNLGALPDSNCSEPFQVNGHGEIVGSSPSARFSALHTFQAFGNSEKPPRNNGLRGALAVE